MLEDGGGVDLVFDVIGGEIGARSARLVRPGGKLVTIAGPTEARPDDGLTIDFVVLPDRAQLSEIIQRVRDGRLRTNIGTVAPLDDAIAAFNPTERRPRKTILRVRQCGLVEGERLCPPTWIVATSPRQAPRLLSLRGTQSRPHTH